MTTEVRRQARSAAQATDGEQPADALVVFGITGDLAKVMTFTSLYRLPRRGPLARPPRPPDRARAGRRVEARRPPNPRADRDPGERGAGGREGLRALREPPVL